MQFISEMQLISSHSIKFHFYFFPIRNECVGTQGLAERRQLVTENLLAYEYIYGHKLYINMVITV